MCECVWVCARRRVHMYAQMSSLDARLGGIDYNALRFVGTYDALRCLGGVFYVFFNSKAAAALGTFFGLLLLSVISKFNPCN